MSFSGRSRLTASSTRECDSLVVTHPFHPLAGQRLPILLERRGRFPLRRVYVCDGGVLGHLFLPETCTDRAEASHAAGPLTVDILTDLAALVAVVRKPLTPGGEERTSPCI